MCGIVYIKSFTGKPVAKTIRKRYKQQRNRGYEGFGFYMPETNRLTHNPVERRALTLLKRENASEILFHHRFPTSTANVRSSCHPFSTKHYLKYNYVGVHNGVLWNEDKLKEEHELLGIKYVSEQLNGRFNDSEALIYDVGRYIEGDVKSITAKGSIAFVVVQRTNKGKPVALYFGRNEGSPLILKEDDNGISISSEGSGKVVEPHMLYRFDYKTHVITKERCVIPSGYTNNACMPYTDDDEDWETAFYNNSYTPADSQTYFEKLENRNKIKANNWYLRLLEESEGNLEDALSLGEWELATLKKAQKKLADKVEIYDSYSEEEYEEYVNIDDDIHVLQKSVDKLKQEVEGSNQMGFRLFEAKRLVESTVGKNN